MSATTPRRITVDAGREAQQNRADVEMGLKTIAQSYGELGLDFEEEMRVRARNAKFLVELAAEFDIPLEMLWRPSGGTSATPAIGEEDPPRISGVRQPG